jgi:hypothetical protein
MEQADGVFIVSAATATFTNKTTLTLTGLQNVTQWIKYMPLPTAGTLSKVGTPRPNLPSGCGIKPAVLFIRTRRD